jgi:hypothetical protein
MGRPERARERERKSQARRVSEWEFVNGAGGKQCDIDVPKHRRSARTGEVESINFGGDDVGIRHDWVLVPFHLIEIISRLCCFVHLRIWNGTKERNTDTAA